MNVSFAWRSGPFLDDEERNTFEAKKVREVKLGGPSTEKDRFELPDAKEGDVWFVIYIEGETVSVLNDAAPYPLTIRRKRDGKWEELRVGTNQTAETKSNDILIFGSDGPSLMCEYKVDLFDKARMGEEYLPSAHGLKSNLPVKVKEFLKVKEKADDSMAKAKKAEDDADVNRRRIIKIGIGGGAVAMGLMVAMAFLFMKVSEIEAAFSASLAGLEDFQKNVDDLQKSRESARVEIERILAQLPTSDDSKREELTNRLNAHRMELLDDMRRELRKSAEKSDAEVVKLKNDMIFYQEEIKKSGSEDIYEVLQKKKSDLYSGIFLLAVVYKAPYRIFPSATGGSKVYWNWGTGFLVKDKDGKRFIVTARHMVQPWKFYRDMAVKIADLDPSLDFSPERDIEIRIRAFSVGDDINTDQAKLEKEYASWEDAKPLIHNVGKDDSRTDGTIRLDKFTNDVAILKLPKGVNGTPLELAPDVKDGVQPIALAGFPLGLKLLDRNQVDPSITMGTIRKVGNFIEHTAPTCGGNSGGPILDAQGRVIGLQSYKHTGEQNVNMGVPVSKILEVLYFSS